MTQSKIVTYSDNIIIKSLNETQAEVCLPLKLVALHGMPTDIYTRLKNDFNFQGTQMRQYNSNFNNEKIYLYLEEAQKSGNGIIIDCK